MKVVWSPLSFERLENIYEFISDKEITIIGDDSCNYKYNIFDIITTNRGKIFAYELQPDDEIL